MPKATSKLAWSATTDEISSLEEMTAALRLEGEKLSRKMNGVKGSTGQTVIYQRAAGANMAPRTHARRVAAVWDEAEERAREEEAARVAAELEQMRLAAEDEAAREAEAEAKRERELAERRARARAELERAERERKRIHAYNAMGGLHDTVRSPPRASAAGVGGEVGEGETLAAAKASYERMQDARLLLERVRSEAARLR